MTREEADKLQDALDECAGDLPPEGAMMRRHQLAAVIEPLLPTLQIPGVGMDLLGVIGIALGAIAPAALSLPMRIAVVDGHADADKDDDGDHEEHMQKYGVRVPGCVVKAAMDLRTTREMFMRGQKMTAEAKEDEKK